MPSRQKRSGDPNPQYFSKSTAVQMGGILPYKWEAYCSTNGRRIAGFPFLRSLEARKVRRYKWGAYCRTNWRCTAVLFGQVVRVGVSETLPIPAAAEQLFAKPWSRPKIEPNFEALPWHFLKGKPQKFVRTRGFGKLTRFRNTENLVNPLCFDMDVVKTLAILDLKIQKGSFPEITLNFGKCRNTRRVLTDIDQERKRRINLRNVVGTLAGCPWNTRRDRKGSTGRCARDVLSDTKTLRCLKR